MSLVRSQKEITRKATEVLRDRGIAFLTGQRNGKTVSIYGLLEGHTTIDEYMKEFPRFKHKEERLVFLQHVRFGKAYSLTTESVMRLILQSLGEPRNIYYGNTYDVRKNFARRMLEAREQSTIFVLPIDNCENLTVRAYSVLKELNEFREGKKDVGVGIALAGYFANTKMPLWFEEMATEILVSKVKSDEIRDIIEELYPKEKHLFTPQALRQLERCATTSILRKILRQQVDDIRAEYISEVKPLAIGIEVDKWNSKFALAA